MIKFTNEEVVYIRKRLGYTRRQFAEKLGVCLATIARWESGKASVYSARPETFKRLCDLLEEKNLL